ncbi:MAG: hypothetical protein HY600_06465 [Candidatus Omnitrophica bacterium]|nr:hypothetical protein [Candidatus Omnitrophota bacterium]
MNLLRQETVEAGVEEALAVALAPAGGLEEGQPAKADAGMSRRHFLGAAAAAPEAMAQVVAGSAAPLTVELVSAITAATLTKAQLDHTYGAMAASVSIAEYLQRPDRFEADPSGGSWMDAQTELSKPPFLLEDQWQLGEAANALSASRRYRALLAKHPETETLSHQLADRETTLRRTFARWVTLRTQDLQGKEQRPSDAGTAPKETPWITRWRTELADLVSLSKGMLDHSEQYSRIALQARVRTAMADEEIAREAVESALAAMPATAWDTPDQQAVSVKSVVESLVRQMVEPRRVAQDTKFGASDRPLNDDPTSLPRLTELLVQQIQHPSGAFYLRTQDGLVLRATPHGQSPGHIIESAFDQRAELRWTELTESVAERLKGAGADNEMVKDIATSLSNRERKTWLEDPLATPETLRLEGVRKYLLALADPEGLSEDLPDLRMAAMLKQLSADELAASALDATRRAALVQRLRDVVASSNWRWAQWGLRIAHRVLGIQIPEAWVFKLAKWRGIPLAKGTTSAESSTNAALTMSQVGELLEGLQVVEWPEATTARALALAQQWPSVAKQLLFVPWNVPAFSERRTPIAVYAPEAWWDSLRGLQTGPQPVEFFSPETLVSGARGLILLDEQAEASRLPTDRPVAIRIHQGALDTLSYELIQQLALQPGLRGRVLLWTPESAQPLRWDQQQYLLMAAEA